eukprot:4844287-Pleurochrysis_carterae.AAC.1
MVRAFRERQREKTREDREARRIGTKRKEGAGERGKEQERRGLGRGRGEGGRKRLNQRGGVGVQQSGRERIAGCAPALLQAVSLLGWTTLTAPTRLGCAIQGNCSTPG